MQGLRIPDLINYSMYFIYIPADKLTLQRTSMFGRISLCDNWIAEGRVMRVTADCDEIVCDCCTHCCDDEGCAEADGEFLLLNLSTVYVCFYFGF